MAIIIVRSRYDADGRMIVTFAGAEPSPIVASIVLYTVLIIYPHQEMLNRISL